MIRTTSEARKVREPPVYVNVGILEALVRLVGHMQVDDAQAVDIFVRGDVISEARIGGGIETVGAAIKKGVVVLE